MFMVAAWGLILAATEWAEEPYEIEFFNNSWSSMTMHDPQNSENTTLNPNGLKQSGIDPEWCVTSTQNNLNFVY